MATAGVSEAQVEAQQGYSIWKVILAASSGTVIEWYDFYIFGTLATTLAPRFYPASAGETISLLLYLATFAVGFVVRPFGAMFFGRIGDLVGRKYAFLVTLLIMGSCTAAIGLLPSYDMIHMAAPIILLLLRILQGLALGGEYGGAAIYVAEHVPDNKRGFYTSFIQITATVGLFIAIIVVIICNRAMSEYSFTHWGYRIPFLISIVLVGVSLFIRLKMKESPIFQTLKDSGKTSKTPLSDALKGWENWKRILTTLFGATAGQGVVWYTGQFYALYYITTILKLDTEAARVVIAVGILLGMPLFTFFGALSDRIGRKKIMLAGMLCGALLYVPIYHGMVSAANTDVVKLKKVIVKGQHEPPARLPERPGQDHHPAGQGQASGQREGHQGGDVGGPEEDAELPAAGLLHLPADGVRDHGLRADRRLSRGGVPSQGALHVAVAALSHGQRHLRWPAATDRHLRHGGDEEPLRRPLLPDHRRLGHVRGGHVPAEGDALHEDLGRARQPGRGGSRPATGTAT